ncbi:MAG: 3-oxoacyl-ACP synthase [bacterium]
MNQIISAYCIIKPYQIRVNGRIEFHDENFITFAEFIKSVYKKETVSYPKFYKMDALSKLGFLSAELILKQINLDLYHREKIGVVLANAASSLDTDLAYQQSINDRSNYFPSPSVFVYTLPNIMIGEICIRHQLKGENAFLIGEKFNSRILFNYVFELFQHNRVEACLTGWVDLMKDGFNSLLMFIEPAEKAITAGKTWKVLPFSAENMDALYNIT